MIISHNQFAKARSCEFGGVVGSVELVGNAIGVEIDNVVKFNVYNVVGERFINIHLSADGHAVGIVLNQLAAAQKQQRAKGACKLKTLGLRVVDAQGDVHTVLVGVVVGFLAQRLTHFQPQRVEQPCRRHLGRVHICAGNQVVKHRYS